MRTDLSAKEVQSLENWKWSPSVLDGQPSNQEIQRWLDRIQSRCEARSLPKDFFPVVAYHFLGDRLKRYIDDCESSYRELAPGFRWNWEAFRMAMDKVTVEVPPGQFTGGEPQTTLPGTAWNETNRLIHEHPAAAGATAAILLAAGCLVVIPAVCTVTLGILGFAPGGIVQGSLAASFHATYGGAVSAGSLLSIAQSAGATGVAATAVGTQIAAGVTGVVGGITSWAAARRSAPRLSAGPSLSIAQSAGAAGVAATAVGTQIAAGVTGVVGGITSWAAARRSTPRLSAGSLLSIAQSAGATGVAAKL